MKFKYRKYIYIGSFSIMILGMMVFSTLPFGKKTMEKGTDSVSTGSSIGISSEIQVASSSAISSGELKKDAYPEVNQLIKDYFTAQIKVDKDAISECVDRLEYVDMDNLPKRVKEIESIGDIVCYTIDGPEEGAYIVYVKNEVKFKDIPTKSSALDGFYVRKDASGKLRVILSKLAPEVQKIIDEDSKREDVVALISSVNEKLTKEIKSDKKLAALLKRMQEDALKEEMDKITKKEDKKEKKDN